MEYPTTITNLVEILRIRQNSSPYNLLLTSTVSLTPEIIKKICGSDNWKEFCNWLQQFGVEDRIDILKQNLKEPPNPDGYRALARLIKEKYFATVLTTNVDSFLDEALFEFGIQPTTYSLLVVNRDTDEHITSVLDSGPQGICIVKLHGSLSDRKIPETYPEIFDLRRDLRASVERYLNRDMVIVGSIEREDDLHRLLSFSSRRSIYYVTPEEPPYNDVVFKAIRGRRKIDPTATMVNGPYGQFEAFFTALDSLLLPNSSIGSDDPGPPPTDTVLSREQPAKTLKTQPSPRRASTTPASKVPQLPGFHIEKLEHIKVSPNAADKPHLEQRDTSSSANSIEPLKSSIPATDQREKRNPNSLVRSVAVIVVLIGGTAGFFLITSLFANNTPSFNAPAIIILFIVVIVVLLGIVGFLNPKQVTDILSKIVGSVSGIFSKGKDNEAEKK